MKYFITLFSLVLILSSCNKKGDEAKMSSGDTTRAVATVDSMQNAIKNNISKEKVATHKGSLDALIGLAQGGPIPPHMLPVKDAKFLEETDSTATYAITSGSTGAKAKVTMKRRVEGKDTTWIMSHIEDMK
ncbi:MAG: hypothetical protein ACHQM6_00900 [Candidatus Kapaibacterium sp.]